MYFRKERTFQIREVYQSTSKNFGKGASEHQVRRKEERAKKCPRNETRGLEALHQAK